MSATETTIDTDVLIGGGGFAGLALAIALRQSLGPAFAVTVADPALERASNDARASAIIAAARRLFETIGVWERVAQDAQPILDMRITDSRVEDAVRPVFLTFAGSVPVSPAQADSRPGSRASSFGETHPRNTGGGLPLPRGEREQTEFVATASSDRNDANAAPRAGERGEVSDGEPFAHMVENPPLLAALLDRARAVGVTLRPLAVTEFSAARSTTAAPRRRPSHHLDVALADGTMVRTRLLVAADGARSRIRQHAGIVTRGFDYPQSSIVTTVAHERDHDGRAEEHFLPGGPFAILPLKGKRCSIVWTEETREAQRLIALSDAEFHAELERRFGLHLGEISVVGPRRAFPISLAVARDFIADRVALVGDAAHVIHPIAGQGLNMGLKDVAALAEVIVDAARLGIDIGAAATLERYQRWRRFDTMTMGIATDGLNRLFSNRSDVLRVVRDVGLGLVERLPALKRVFIREAAGLAGDVPKLLRGEAL